MNNKNAISAVVATVLIILITVAAVAIIWAAIIPMIKNQISGGTVCLDAVAALSVKGDYTCKQANGNNITVQVAKAASGSSDFDLVGIRFIVHNAGKTKSYNTTSNLPGTNEERRFTIKDTDLGTGGNDFIKGAEGVSIAPVVKQGNQQKECDASSIATLRNC